MPSLHDIFRLPLYGHQEDWFRVADEMYSGIDRLVVDSRSWYENTSYLVPEEPMPAVQVDRGIYFHPDGKRCRCVRCQRANNTHHLTEEELIELNSTQEDSRVRSRRNRSRSGVLPVPDSWGTFEAEARALREVNQDPAALNVSLFDGELREMYPPALVNRLTDLENNNPLLRRINGTSRNTPEPTTTTGGTGEGEAISSRPLGLNDWVVNRTFTRHYRQTGFTDTSLDIGSGEGDWIGTYSDGSS